jgi:hypothetical protein
MLEILLAQGVPITADLPPHRKAEHLKPFPDAVLCSAVADDE